MTGQRLLEDRAIICGPSVICHPRARRERVSQTGITRVSALSSGNSDVVGEMKGEECLTRGTWMIECIGIKTLTAGGFGFRMLRCFMPVLGTFCVTNYSLYTGNATLALELEQTELNHKLFGTNTFYSQENVMFCVLFTSSNSVPGFIKNPRTITIKYINNYINTVL